MPSMTRYVNPTSGDRVGKFVATCRSTLRSVIGAALYLAVLGLLALGLGALIRRTAGAIAAIVAVIIILPVLVQGLSQSWQNTLTAYLPSSAGQAAAARCLGARARSPPSSRRT